MEIELSPRMAHGVVPKDYYGYSYDWSWKVKMEFQRSRIVKCRQRAQVLRLPKDEAVTYLLARHAAIFKLMIKSTDEMYYEANGDGSCGYRVLLQAAQRALVAIVVRVGAPEDISYKDGTDKLEGSDGWKESG